MALVKTEGYQFDDFLWIYIKSFILVHQCARKNCSGPGVVLDEAYLVPGRMEIEYAYICHPCFDLFMVWRPGHKKIIYDRIRSEVSTKVIGIATLRQRVNKLSDKNLLRLLNIPRTVRNKRALRTTLSYVFLYKLPAEEKKDAKAFAL